MDSTKGNVDRGPHGASSSVRAVVTEVVRSCG